MTVTTMPMAKALNAGLRKAMAVAGVLPSFKEMDARAEAWRPWRAYAALHLWMSLGGGTGG